MSPKPVLDPAPSGKPHDFSLRKIMAAKPPVEVIIPDSWENPFVKQTAPRDQSFRGTCVGQSTATCYDLRYMELTGDLPTATDNAKYQKDIRDSIGTLHDILYPQSASAEQFYQVSRTIGNVTYPAGSETRFAARAWINYGMNLEEQWHTDKEGKCVWEKEPRKTVDGGLSPADAKTWAAQHKAEGWVMVGDEHGNATYDEICQAIYKYKFVLAGIPVYENYGTMEGGDGEFPRPSGPIVGYHALCFYGYTPNKLKLVHSWGDFCGRFGAISKDYFNNSKDESVYLVITDAADIKIAREIYKSLTVTAKDSKTKQPIPAELTINGIVIGLSPQKFAVEVGKTYEIAAGLVGYKPLKSRWSTTNKKKLSFSLTLSLKKKGG